MWAGQMVGSLVGKKGFQKVDLLAALMVVQKVVQMAANWAVCLVEMSAA